MPSGCRLMPHGWLYEHSCGPGGGHHAVLRRPAWVAAVSLHHPSAHATDGGQLLSALLLPASGFADVHPDAPAGWCQEAQEEDLHQAQEAEAQVRRRLGRGGWLVKLLLQC